MRRPSAPAFCPTTTTVCAGCPFVHSAQPVGDERRGHAGCPPSFVTRAVFNTLKKAFTTAPVLRHFDPDLDVLIETDASDYAISAVFTQPHDGVLHPVAFHSRKMDEHQRNYCHGPGAERRDAQATLAVRGEEPA